MLRDNKLERESSESSELIYEAELVEQNKDSTGLFLRKLKTTSSLQLKDSLTNLFTISVDGSSHSEIALEVVMQEFLGAQSKLIVAHIYSKRMNESYNYKNKKETVVDTYSNKIMSLGNRARFVVEDRTEGIVHSLEQVKNLAMHVQSNFLVCGYYGIKGPKGDNNELTKGVNYLLGNSRIPTIIFKDTPLRSKKPSKGYSWLVVLDKRMIKPIRCFQNFSCLINPDKDLVSGLTLMNEYQDTKNDDDLKEQFLTEIENNGIQNFNYECVNYPKTPSTIISEKVNYGDINFDFVVFLYNRERHKNEGSNSDVSSIVKMTNCTLCFLSY